MTIFRLIRVPWYEKLAIDFRFDRKYFRFSENALNQYNHHLGAIDERSEYFSPPNRVHWFQKNGSRLPVLTQSTSGFPKMLLKLCWHIFFDLRSLKDAEYHVKISKRLLLPVFFTSGIMLHGFCFCFSRNV